MKLAGGPIIAERGFRAVVPNITPDSETGIGRWSDAEIAAAIRDGRRPEGTLIGPPMPIELYRGRRLLCQCRRRSCSSPAARSRISPKGMVLEAQKRLEEAFREDETAVTLNANHASAYAHMGYIKRSMGSPEEAIPLLEQAIRISPRDPDIGTWYEVIGQAHLLQSRIDAAVVWAEKARADNPARPSLHALLACAYALNGESERAAAELAEARRLSSDDRYSSISRFKSVASFRPKTLALYEPTYFAGLRKAGMPEE
jgi:tetratricopeptide (TPR) repeat protein